MLSRETQKEPISLSVVFNSKTDIDSSYHYVLSSNDLHTHLYPTTADLTNDPSLSTYLLYVLEHSELSDARVSSVFSVARNLSGIGYNYLVEIPESTVQNEYYQDGFI